MERSGEGWELSPRGGGIGETGGESNLRGLGPYLPLSLGIQILIIIPTYKQSSSLMR